MNTNFEKILFNPVKHHLIFLKLKLDELNANHPDFEEKVKELLSHLGTSVLDLYVGNLSVEKILDEVINKIPYKSIQSKKEFIAWISEAEKDFRIIRISDNSEWILRYLNREKFIHLFPARYSEMTLRCKASTLKTASLLYLFRNDIEKELKTNSFRQDLFLLPPLKLPFAGRFDVILELIQKHKSNLATVSKLKRSG